jgi:hypothetical protein
MYGLFDNNIRNLEHTGTNGRIIHYNKFESEGKVEVMDQSGVPSYYSSEGLSKTTQKKSVTKACLWVNV